MINMKIGVVPRQRCAPCGACPNGAPNRVHTAYCVCANVLYFAKPRSVIGNVQEVKNGRHN